MTVIRAFLYARNGSSTFTSYIKEVVNDSRAIFRFLIDENLQKPLKAYSKSEVFFVTSSDDIVKKIFIFTRTLIHRIIIRYISTSFAVTLRRNRININGRVPLICFVGLSMIKEPTLLTEKQELEGITWEIRKMFSYFKPSSLLDTENLNPGLNNFKFGNVLAKGCNAVVYSARKNVPLNKITNNDPLNTSYIDTSDSYNIAIKIMFNYEAESNAVAIWRAMNKEIIPARAGMFNENLSHYLNRNQKKYLPFHYNIVDMIFAFADKMPALPEAMSLFPEALPVKFNENGCGHNMTLFIVMKRYHCTLSKYLQNHKPSYHTSLLLLTQLLEGVTHLVQHQISHRDLKLDNILIDLSQGMANPHLVITDFGCCLSENCSLQLPYHSDEIFKGGNILLMAPEVINAQPGIFSIIDYSRADLWTVGTLAYEIFGAENPFYPNSVVQLKHDSYNETDLPSLPNEVPFVVTKLIKDILKKDFTQRPSPAFCATVCQLLIHAPRHWLKSYQLKHHQKILDWLVNTAGITICQVKNNDQSPIEQQLRVTFFSRVQLSEVIKALEYIIRD